MMSPRSHVASVPRAIQLASILDLDSSATITQQQEHKHDNASSFFVYLLVYPSSLSFHKFE